MSVSGGPGDRYTIVRELGRGGMSVVYLAHDRKLDREVALKEIVLRRAESGLAARLVRALSFEAAALRHENIVSVFECFDAADRAYLVSEYLGSGSLRPWVGRLTLAQTAGVLEQVLAALSYAHDRGILHRDLKPENVLVAREGTVKVSDFRVAHAQLEAQTRLTEPSEETVGTPVYMAPEQAMARDTGPWTDLYSLGVMAYELILGRVPFDDDEGPVAILLKHVNEPPPPPQSIDPSLDPRLGAWLEQLLEKDPAARPTNAQRAWDDLQEIVVGLLGAGWRRDARLLPEAVPSTAPPSFAPAPEPGLAALLRSAAETGVVPAESDRGSKRASVPRPPAPTMPAPAVPEPAPALEPGIEAAPVARSDSYVSSAPGREPRSMLIRFVAPLLVLGAVAAAARWLFGLFELDEWEPAASDVVQCTVFAPPSAAPEEQMLVQVFVHLPDEAKDARAIASELDTTARRRAFRSLESPVRVGSRLDVELQLPGLRIDDPIDSVVWRRRTEAVQFAVTVPAATPTGTIIGTVSVSVDSVPVGHVKFKLAIESEGVALPSEPQGEHAHRYRLAFISYSSKDRGEVLRRVQLLSVVGIRYFQDVLSLEPGDRWSKRIELGIDECDLFLLFWSSDARQSEAVRQEVRHALARKHGNDLSPPEIRPVVLEGPPIAEPWEELAHLHFNDRILYFVRPPQASRRPCPRCGHRNEEDADFCGRCGLYLRWKDEPR